MNTKPSFTERLYQELKQEHSRLNENYDKLYNTYLEAQNEHMKITEKYYSILAENNRLTEELQKEKAAYISLKGRLHASNYTMSKEEFQAIMLDTKHKIMLSHNTELPI